MSQKTLTHKDLARLLKVSETTIKSYRRKFPSCIPVFSQGRPIRFTPEALPVCRMIRDLFEQGMEIAEVRLRLATEFPWIQAELPGQDNRIEESDASAHAQHVQQHSEETVRLPQGFSTAISGLAKSVVALTRQQAEILQRINGLEDKILSFSNGISAKDIVTTPINEPALSKESAEILPQAPNAAQPQWADELAEKLEVMEQAIVRTLESLGDQLKIPLESGEEELSVFSTESMLKKNEKARVIPWTDPVEAKPSREYNVQSKFTEEYLRHISTLPLAVSISGDYTGLAGRGPFCLNDLKAILAQTFSPPSHYVGRWETASGECWYILEQPEEADGETINLHLQPVENNRNQKMLEVVRLMVGGSYEHPSALYAFVQQLLG